MPLTREFKATVQDRVKRDPAFRDALLAEGIESLLSGDVETGKAILRDYINATLGFGSLAEATGSDTKNLMRMFGPRGNPTAKNLMAVVGHLQRVSGISLHVKTDSKPQVSRSKAA